MQVLVLEDDPMMQELLTAILQSCGKQISVVLAETVGSGLALCNQAMPDLILCDWHLPEQKNGLDFVKALRKHNTQVPVIMITGQGDRATVVNSLRFGANDFIVKPFAADAVARRLQVYIDKILQADQQKSVAADVPALSEWLANAEAQIEHLSIMANTRSLVDTLVQADKPSAKELAKQWQQDAAITTRLIQVANSSLMRREGKAVASLLDAITAMGVDMAISQVMAIALKQPGCGNHAGLATQVDGFIQRAAKLAETAAQLAKALDEDIALSYTAGLMVYLGDLAVLDAMGQYMEAGGELHEADIAPMLKAHANRYGHAVKKHWHIPLMLRQRIGACYVLSESAVENELLLMRAAALKVAGQTDSPQYLKLQRQLGLDA